MLTSLRILTVAALLMVAGCTTETPPAVNAVITADSDVIDEAGATKVATDVWAARRSAYVENNESTATETLRKVAAGPVLVSDLSWINVEIARRVTKNSPAPAPSYPDLNSVAIALGKQRSYPATFLAFTSRPILDGQGKPTADNDDRVELFVKADPDAPWKITNDISLDDFNSIPDRARTDDGWVTVADDLGQRRLTAQRHLRTAINGGAIPADSPFEGSAPLQAFIDARKSERDTQAEQLVLDQTVIADDSWSVVETPIYSAKSGDALFFATLPARRTLTSTSVCLTQSDDMFVWGPALAAGQYRSLTIEWVISALIVLPADAAKPAQLLDIQPATARIVGSPC